MIQLPRVGLLACEKGASSDCIIVVVVLDATFTHVSVHTWKNQALSKTSH